MNIAKDMIALDQSFTDKNDAIRFAGKLLVDQQLAEEAYIEKMIERDEDLSTYMGNFIAIPHGTEDARSLINQSGISIVQVPEGVRFGENLVTVIFGIAGKDGEHLDLLSQIAVLCEDVGNVQKIADAQTKEEILSLIEGE
jgi:PTS system mannitol-specific IIA component